MTYFLTNEALQRGTKAILGGRIVTPIDMSGDKVKIAEDGKWHHYGNFNPLTEDQLREEEVSEVLSHCEGKSIVTLSAQGKGVQFVLSDNTRVGLDYASDGSLSLSVVAADGERLL